MSLEKAYKAMRHLMQQEKIPLQLDDFPDSITLPSTITVPIQGAIERTTRNGHEYSINFRHNGEDWRAGLPFKGTTMNVGEAGELRARTNKLHTQITTLHVPDIRMHTHTPVSKQLSGASVAIKAKLQDWGGQKVETEAALAWNKMQVAKPFPSWKDTWQTYSFPRIALAYIVATNEASFIMVNSSPIDPSIKNTFNRPDYRTDVLRKDFIAMEDGVDERAGEPIAEQRDFIASSLASMLLPRFVCYVSTEGSSSDLIRVL